MTFGLYRRKRVEKKRKVKEAKKETVNNLAKLLPIDSHTVTHSSNLRYESTTLENPLTKFFHNPVLSRMMMNSIFQQLSQSYHNPYYPS